MEGLKKVGQIQPVPARRATGSPWTIGAETADRGYIDFSRVAPFLGPLGASRVRIQGGWARCDRGDGLYHWGWLDEIVQAAVDQRLRPWFQLSYGNPAYSGGGGLGLAEGMPCSAEALAAWDRWVRAAVTRYRDRVEEWEVWNEPDFRGPQDAARYTDLFCRTARTLLREQPRARIAGPALANDLEFARRFLEGLEEAGGAARLHEFSFHGYPVNPDDGFELVDSLRALLAKHAPRATLRQGETGAPSESTDLLALRGQPWSEWKQAAWNLRRMIAHHARGIPASLFQIADMYYRREGGARFEGRNPKGLLWTREDGTVERPKLAYRVAQGVFSVFGADYPLRELSPLTAEAPDGRRVEAYAWTACGQDRPNLVAWWDATEPPGVEPRPAGDVALPGFNMDDPVLIDFMSASVFAPLNRSWLAWDRLPLTDTVFAVAERSTLRLDTSDLDTADLAK